MQLKMGEADLNFKLSLVCFFFEKLYHSGLSLPKIEFCLQDN